MTSCLPIPRYSPTTEYFKSERNGKSHQNDHHRWLSYWNKKTHFYFAFYAGKTTCKVKYQTLATNIASFPWRITDPHSLLEIRYAIKQFWVIGFENVNFSRKIACTMMSRLIFIPSSKAIQKILCQSRKVSLFICKNTLKRCPIKPCDKCTHAVFT